MIEHLRYVNSKGDEMTFGPGTCWEIGSHDLFDLNLEARETGGVITSHHYPTTENHLELRMVGGSVEERNRLIDLVSYDVGVGERGTLWAGESYRKCLVYGFEQSLTRMRDSVIRENLLIRSDKPAWIRKKAYTLVPYDNTTVGGLDYPYDYPHDYLFSRGSSVDIVNPFQLPCKCDIVFPGPCTSPYVIIAGNRYEVEAQANKGDLIIIRGFSGDKPDVVIRFSDGSEKSLFDKAYRKDREDAFAEIPVGKHDASWSGAFNVEVILYEERTAPWYV